MKRGIEGEGKGGGGKEGVEDGRGVGRVRGNTGVLGDSELKKQFSPRLYLI